MLFVGVDFTSAPGQKKPITAAFCHLDGATLIVEEVREWTDFGPFEAFLASPGPWAAGLDFPFGLPTAFVRAMNWPESWAEYVAVVERLGRAGFRDAVNGFKAPRPPGAKDLKRRTDIEARAASPLNVTRPPVGLMFAEGAPRLLASGASVLPMAPGRDPERVAMEAYPALMAERLIGGRRYKDGPPQAVGERRDRRAALVRALPARLPRGLAQILIEDPGADRLDAVLCALQAAEAWRDGDEARRPATDDIAQEGMIVGLSQ